MSGPSAPRFTPGEPVSGPKANRLADLAELASNVAGLGGSGGFGSAGATPDDGFIWALVTYQGDGDPHPHAFVQVHEDRDTGVFEEVSGGLAGSVEDFPLYDVNNKCLAINTVVKAWVGNGDWMVCDHCCGVTCPLPTTTTTTMQPCVGGCRWVWQFDLNAWLLVFSTCGDCLCQPPQFCGSLGCEDTRTECGRGAAPAPVCGTTTTTTGTTSSTTLPPNVTCSGDCEWRYKLGGWYMIAGDCSAGAGVGCHCAFPDPASFPGGTPADCVKTTTPCLYVGTTTLPPYCLGKCDWFWDPDILGWVKLSHTCQGYRTPQCYCDPPSRPGSPCEIAPPTPCWDHSQTGSTTPPPQPTTTPPPGSCTGTCKWKWGGSDWAFVSTNCSTSVCACYAAPDYDGISTCETAEMPCQGTTTTTTTTTACPTTTTTTADPGCGRCVWRWTPTDGGGFWVATANGCGTDGFGRCECNPPPFDGDDGCKLTASTGCISHCTTTTCVPTTTTTAGPCGYCTFQTIRAYSAGCPSTEWWQVASDCSDDATCPGAPGGCVPPAVGVTSRVACTGCTTTTTGGPTTTTSCAFTTTTTALPPVGECGSCGTQTCLWGWTGSSWSLDRFGCCYNLGEGAPECYCDPPPAAGLCRHDQYLTACLLASGTSTTTTPAPPCGTCSYQCVATVWNQTANNCTGGCFCSPPVGACTGSETTSTNCL